MGDGDGNMNPKVVGHDLGMSDRMGTVEIGMPLHSAAESTSQNCQRQYGGHSGCRFIQIKTTTLDDAIGLRRASKACQVNVQACAIAPIDVLKIHVQGHEMQVLRGARRTLKSGLLCVLVIRILLGYLCRKAGPREGVRHPASELL